MELRLRRGAQLLGRFQVTVHCFRDSAHAGTAALGPQVEIEVRSPVPAYLARTGTT